MLWRLIRTHRSFASALLCVLWLLGGVLGQLHQAVQVHVVCAVHNEVEHGVSAATLVDDAPDGDHGERCDDLAIPLLPVVLPSPAISLAPLVQAPAITPCVRSISARGPPLVFAPKTSPPRVG